MRIIGGTMKGLQLHAPKDLPVRPTTDQAKEALFNILSNLFDFDKIDCLDLFAGTGNISLELCSRGCKSVIAVDKHSKCLRYIQTVVKTQKILQLQMRQSDVYTFLENCSSKFDLIFADPPYDMPNLFKIPGLVFDKHLLTTRGCLIIEHSSLVQLNHATQYRESRKYGSSAFSFFYLSPEENRI